MAVTIQMIETKEFKTKAHGYDPEEVDVFLDEIADEFEEMQREIQSPARRGDAPERACACRPRPRTTARACRKCSPTRSGCATRR